MKFINFCVQRISFRSDKVATQSLRLTRFNRLRMGIVCPIISVLLLFVASTSVLRAQLPNPAAYLTFDEGAGTVAHDSSGNNHNATLQGGAGWTAGLVGSHALSLPGAPGSYADIPTGVIDTTHNDTVAAWVKLNNVNGEQTFVSEDGFPSPPLCTPFRALRGMKAPFSWN
jgi:hypothetical protein